MMIEGEEKFCGLDPLLLFIMFSCFDLVNKRYFLTLSSINIYIFLEVFFPIYLNIVFFSLVFVIQPVFFVDSKN